jgi:co-chaperonin GroES (HSP10)
MSNPLPYEPNSRDVVFAVKEKTDSGLFLPETAQQRHDIAVELIAVGAECKRAKVGDKVYLRQTYINEIILNEKRYCQVSEGDILGWVLPGGDSTVSDKFAKEIFGDATKTN